MITKVIVVLLIAALVLFFPARPSFAGNTLQLTVSTNTRYTFGNNVYVSGSLIWVPANIPATNGIIGVEVTEPSGQPLIFRTVPTGSITSQNWLVNIIALYPCNANQVPTHSFTAGEAVYVYAQWQNFDLKLPHTVYCAITIYGANSVPLGYQLFSSSALAPNSTVAAISMLATIPTSTSGNVTLYASLFSDLPANGGYPYCPEQNTTFTIGTPTSISAFESSSGGYYNFSFKLPPSGIPEGNYTAYATTDYNDVGNYYYAANNAKFSIVLVGDINGDGVVNILDAILLADAFGSVPGDSNWNPAADLNGDGVVNILDAILLSDNFGA
jgi:hypothetical protein